MRYFTRGWANGEHDDGESARVVASYQQRLAEIGPRLPPAMQELGKLGLHDAILDCVRWHPKEKRLVVVFVTAGKEGALAVTATYEGAMLGEHRIESLRNAAWDRATEVLYGEVDLGADGLLVHRLLFWPREELTIDFASLQLEVAPRVDFRVQLGAAFLEIHPEDSVKRR